MWIYHRKDNRTSELHDEFINGVEEFDRFARTQNEYMVNGVCRSPCTKCKNAKYLTPYDVKLHLYKKDFVRDYRIWMGYGEVHDMHHGEGSSSGGWNDGTTVDGDYEEPTFGGFEYHHMEAMVNDAVRYEESNVIDGPTVKCERNIVL